MKYFSLFAPGFGVQTTAFPVKEKVYRRDMKVQETKFFFGGSEDCCYFVVLTILSSLFNHIGLIGSIGKQFDLSLDLKDNQLKFADQFSSVENENTEGKNGSVKQGKL